MERDSLHGMDQQPLSLYKSHIRNTNPIMEPFLCTPNYNSFSTSKGLLKAPPLSLLHSTPFSLQPQPPLLPLPRRSSSCPTKTGTRNQKKSTKSSTSKINTTIPKKEEKKTPPKRSLDSTPTITSTSKLGAETAAQPKNIARVARFDNSVKDVIKDRVDMLLGSVVFAISPPPPSSLPLPTFSLRPKLRCNAAAAGIDAGATDDLRRLLRLQ